MKKQEKVDEVGLLNKVIPLYKEKLAALEQDEKTIEERYKKMMDAELSDIVRKKTLFTEGLDSLERLLESYEKNVSSTDKVQSKPTATTESEIKKEEEPVIQDTLFPENNEPESEQSSFQETEETTDKPEGNSDNDAGTELPLDENEVISEPEFDSAGFTFDDNEKESETQDSDEDNWPDMPTEWN